VWDSHWEFPSSGKPTIKTKSIWLVVSTPLKNMKVSWDEYSQYMKKTCSKPPTSYYLAKGTKWPWLPLLSLPKGIPFIIGFSAYQNHAINKRSYPLINSSLGKMVHL